MADNSDSRSRRATALEEKKRRLEELKARRAAAAAEDATTTPANFGAPASGTGATGGGLDDYIDNLLSSSVPLPTSEPDSAAIVKKDTEAVPETKEGNSIGAKASAPSAISGAPPTAEAPKKKHVETFEVGTQTEEGDFPPPLTVASDSEGEDEATKERIIAEGVSEDKKEEDDGDQNSKGTQVNEFHLLTEQEKEEKMKDSSFGTFVVKASKRMERLLEQQDTNSFLAAALWEEPYALDEEKEEEDAEDSKWEDAAVTKGLLQSGGHSRLSLECSKWTHTRFVTDLDWSGVHNEVLVASYSQPGSATMQRNAHEDKESSATNTNHMASKGTPSSFISAQYAKEAANSDGLAMVWSLTMPYRPEFLFTSGASGPIGCVKFLPSSAAGGNPSDNQHLVVGGCDNGQLLLWDLRNGRLPVQKSNLSVASLKGKNVNHAFRICSLKIAEGGSGLASASSDGRVNVWSLSNLRDPAESYMVEGNVSALAVAPESHSIVCGDERGGLHSITLPSSAQGGVSGGAPVGDNKRLMRSFKLSSSMDIAPSSSLVEGGAAPRLPGHFGMITSIATHGNAGSGSTSSSTSGRSLRRGFLRSVQGMFLTTGVDWTTKLWAPAFSDDAPLLNFTSSSYDYMTDATWCPTNPTVFATSSTTSIVDIWNLAHSIETPLSGSDGLNVHKIMRPGRTPSDGAVPSLGPVNKMEWSNDGKRIAVAAGDQIHVLGVSENVFRAKGDEEARLMNHLTARGLVQRDD